MFVWSIRWLYEASMNFDKPENSKFFSTLVVFLVVLVIVRLIQIFRELKSLPPGPWGLPIFGYLPFLKTEAHIHFGELAKKYGSLFSTRLGNQLIVVVSDHKAIREAFRREEFTGRPHTEFSNILGGYGKFFIIFFPSPPPFPLFFSIILNSKINNTKLNDFFFLLIVIKSGTFKAQISYR